MKADDFGMAEKRVDRWEGGGGREELRGSYDRQEREREREGKGTRRGREEFYDRRVYDTYRLRTSNTSKQLESRSLVIVMKPGGPAHWETGPEDMMEGRRGNGKWKMEKCRLQFARWTRPPCRDAILCIIKLY